MFTGTLYKPQIPAAEKLVNRKKALLAWEQGTGKTVIAIAAISKLFEMKRASSALIVVPTSIAWQWEQKFQELSILKPQLSIASKSKTREYEKLAKQANGTHIQIVPYSLFRRDFKKFAHLKWDIVVYDEAQEFKNNKSVTAQRVKALNRIQDIPYRWALTGTTISTKLEELYSIFFGIDKGFLPEWPIFEENHIVRNELGGIFKYKNLNALNKLLQHRMDRKTHADMAGQMPTRVEVVHKIEPSKEYLNEQAVLVNLLDNMVDNISFDLEGNPRLPDSSPVKKAYQRATALLCGERKISKAKALIYEILSENSANRVVVFSRLKKPLYELHSAFKGDSRLFTGDQSSDQRQKAVEHLSTGECRILFASNAGSTGLDLPFCNYLIHLDVSPSHVIDDQRNKRITRLSSVHPTAVCIYLVVDSSLEQFILYIVKRRGELAKAVQEGGDDEVIVRPISLRKYLRGEDD